MQILYNIYCEEIGQREQVRQMNTKEKMYFIKP